MSMRRFLDWKGYLEGFYLVWIKTVTTTLLTAVGTNAAAASGISALKDVGLSLKQAGSMLLVITIVEVLKYLQAKPIPDTKTEEVDTTIITKP